MATESTVAKWNWLWAILIMIGLSGITATAVTQSQVTDLHDDVAVLESSRVETAKDVAEIKTTQKQQAEDVKEIKADIKVLLREVKEDDRNRR